MRGAPRLGFDKIIEKTSEILKIPEPPGDRLNADEVKPEKKYFAGTLLGRLSKTNRKKMIWSQKKVGAIEPRLEKNSKIGKSIEKSSINHR